MAAIFPLSKIVSILEPRVALGARAPMGAVPIAPGKHVNRAAVVGPSFDLSTLTRSDGDQNCALCAAAGCVNLAVGYVKFTTKKVAKIHKVSDDLQAFGKRAEQEEKIIRFVGSNLPGYQLAVYGSDANRIDEATAQAKMNACADGTVFVVSATGGISKYGGARATTSWGHWMNAVKKDGQVIFVDFQTDHEQRLGRGFVSTGPILGNFGVEWDSPRMQVIAFSPPLHALTDSSSGNTSPRTSGDSSSTNAAAMLPMPVHAATAMQPVIPLHVAPRGAPTNRQLRGRAVNLGTGQQVDNKLKRHAGTFGNL